MDRPVPPPPKSSTQAVEPRRPGLRATALAGQRIPAGSRAPLRRRTVDVNGLSVRELAECWGVSARVAQLADAGGLRGACRYDHERGADLADIDSPGWVS